MRRREFITLASGAAITWPLAASAQQPAMPVVGFIRDGTAEASVRYVASFHQGLSEVGVVEGQNVTVEHHWIEGHYDRLPALMADLVRRQVAVMVTMGNLPALAAKTVTATIRLRRRRGPDQAWSCRQLRPARRQCDRHQFFHPGDHIQRLRLLHELVPNAVRVAVLLNPANAW